MFGIFSCLHAFPLTLQFILILKVIVTPIIINSEKLLILGYPFSMVCCQYVVSQTVYISDDISFNDKLSKYKVSFKDRLSNKSQQKLFFRKYIYMLCLKGNKLYDIEFFDMSSHID